MRRWCALIACALVTMACTADASDAGVVRFQVSGEPEETAVYSALAKAYRVAHPERRVEIVRVADKDDHLARLSSSFAAGNPPDVFLLNYREYAQFVARGALKPVGRALEERGLHLGDYYQPPVDAFTYRGALQCMPQNVSSLVVYLNRDLFEAAGVPLPEAGWTWREFTRTAQQLSGDGVHGVGIDSSVIRVAPFVWSAGGDLVDDPERPTRFTLDTPAAQRALTDLAALLRDERTSPSLKEQTAQDLETRFTTGKLAMYLGSRRDTPKFREVRGLDTAVVELPVRNNPATILHSDAYCLARSTANAEAALDFIAFAVGEQGQRLAALSGRTVPSLKSVAESPVFLDDTKPPAGSQAFLDGIGHMRATPVIPTWPEIEDIARDELSRYFYEGTDLDEVIAELDRRTRPLFEAGSS